MEGELIFSKDTALKILRVKAQPIAELRKRERDPAPRWGGPEEQALVPLPAILLDWMFPDLNFVDLHSLDRICSPIVGRNPGGWG